MKKIISWLSSKDFFYLLARKIIANRIIYSKKELTPQYLIEKGWVLEGIYSSYVEPDIKDRDKIWIRFDGFGNYSVWHGKNRTFITLHTKIEWFENYYMLAHSDNGIYQLAGC